MTTIKQDEHHIIETMNRDVELAKQIRKLSKSALLELSVYLNDFFAQNSENVEIDGIVLGYVPTKQQIRKIGDLISEFDDEDVPHYSEMDTLVDMLKETYRKNNGAYLQAVIGLVLMKLLRDVTNLQGRAAGEEEKTEVKYLFGNGGQFENKMTQHEAINLPPKDTRNIDNGNGTLDSINYYNTVDVINHIHKRVTDTIKQDATQQEFTAMIGAMAIKQAVVSKEDVAHTHAKRVISQDVTGDFERLGADYMRAYRTASAEWDSALKYAIAKQLKIKTAIIINEMLPCNLCLTRINREMDVEIAVSYVPQHPSCRCEVRLIDGNGDVFDDVDVE